MKQHNEVMMRSAKMRQDSTKKNLIVHECKYSDTARNVLDYDKMKKQKTTKRKKIMKKINQSVV